MQNSTSLNLSLAKLRAPGALDAIVAEQGRRRHEAEHAELAANLDQVRESCRTLRGFIAAAWHIVEPANKFVHGWHLDAVADHLEAVTTGQITRLLINEPTGLMKSLEASVLWPAWEWGPAGRPHHRFIATSHSDRFTTRDTRRMRDLVWSWWFRQLWPLKIVKSGEHLITNDKTGWREGVPMASLTGSRADRVIIDDPHSTETAESDAERNTTVRIFRESIPTRLTDPERSAIIVIMQRLHENDVSEVARELGYEHLMLPMEYEPERCCYTSVKPTHSALPQTVERIARHPRDKLEILTERRAAVIDEREQPLLEWQSLYRQDPRRVDGELLFPERFPQSVVDRDKRALGSHAWATQMQQRPTPRQGGLFKRAWFEILPAMPVGRWIWVRGWDLAATKKTSSNRPAYTAGVRMAYDMRSGLFAIDDVVRIQGSPGEVEALIRNTATQDGYNVRIGIPRDPGQAAKSQVLTFAKMLAGYTVRFSEESQKKETRATPVSAQAEVGNLKLIAGEWNRDYLDEVAKFPGGAYKDQVDATSRAFADLLGWARNEGDIGMPISVGR